MNLDDYDVLIFDLDGLIIDSLDNLSSALQDSVRSFANASEFTHFRKYDLDNPGLSRFVKVNYFCKKIVKNRSVDQSEILRIFNQKSLEARIKSTISSAIFKLYKKYNYKTWIILTNCDATQIFQVLDYFNLTSLFFPNIFGTPPSKNLQAKKIVQNFSSKKSIIISDSESDGMIAKDVGTDFLFVEEFSRGNENWVLQNYYTVPNLSSLI